VSEFLVARAAIEDLVHTYALNIRSGKPAECMKLFTEDAVFEVREPQPGSSDGVRTRSKWTDLDAISTHLARTMETRICPFISNLLINVRRREATSTCLMTSLVWSRGLHIVGEYHDTYRYDTDWRFSSRVFTILGEFSHQPAPSSSHKP
jgi:hypothetical protein